jgi:hypothetical protein
MNPSVVETSRPAPFVEELIKGSTLMSLKRGISYTIKEMRRRKFSM